MSDETIPRPIKTEGSKSRPHTFIELDNLGLPRDYFYQHWQLTGTCARCGCDHATITAVHNKYTPKKVWRWHCKGCGQDWLHTRWITKRKICRMRFSVELNTSAEVIRIL